jgi:hypothetical protein
VTAERVELAHPPDTRQAALDALPVHGSLRKAAAAAGVSKSSLHRWSKSTPVSADPAASNLATSSPGTPATADLPAPITGAVNATTDELVEGEAQYDPQTADPVADDGAPSFADRLDDPSFLQAMHRYVNLVASGTLPRIAQEGARIIDPYFMLTDAEDAKLREAVERFTGAQTEVAIFALSEPVFVSKVAQQFQFDSATTNDLLDAMTQVRTDGWIAGINAGLAAHDRPLISDITDDKLLNSIQQDAADSVNGVVASWNADASAKAFALWQGIKDDPQFTTAGDREYELRTQMYGWRDDRVEGKSAQWSGDQAAQGLFDATKEWQDQNGTGTVGWVEPQDGQCEACNEAIALGSPDDPCDADTLLDLDLPLHPRCPHGVHIEQQSVDADTPLWGEDLGPVADDQSPDDEGVAEAS